VTTPHPRLPPLFATLRGAHTDPTTGKPATDDDQT
jgi:hypothetical protein